MKRAEVLKIIKEHRKEFDAYGVSSLAVFGSTARDEARPDSDVDILVEFSQSVGLFEFIRLKNRLEALLGLPVDLVTPDALRLEMREQILKEAIHA
jgi:predicted nucleotidyltransferase